MFVDSHCHLALVRRPEADEALEHAREAGVAGFMVPATRLDDAIPAVELAERHPDVWAAVGFHPHEAKDFDETAEAQLIELARAKRIQAVGEIGLDYHYDHSPRDVQKRVFLRQIAIAREYGLPVIIHNRESTDDLLELLGRDEVRGTPGVLHSFTESQEVAEELIARGFYISFSGIVTFRNAEGLREVARSIPLESLLIETDTPFLAPVPHRGRSNQPAWVVRVAEVIARARGIETEEVGRAATANFEKLFAVRIAT
jgi:TatD DNase family protein